LIAFLVGMAQNNLICVASWNVMQIPPSNEINLLDWVPKLSAACAIYFLTLQEAVKVDNVNDRDGLIEKDKNTKIFAYWNQILLQHFSTIRDKQVALRYTSNLGGNLMSVFIGEEYLNSISDEESLIQELSRSKTTIKAGLSYRMKFTNSHKSLNIAFLWSSLIR